MRYIVTSKHPELKEGITFERRGTEFVISNYQGLTYIRRNDIELMETQGYIKEVEEKEFKKSDVKEIAIDFCKAVNEYYQKGHSINSAFEDFINNRNNE